MIDRDVIKSLIAAGQIRDIFIRHLGWDAPRVDDISLVVKWDDSEYIVAVKIIAHKRSFAVCEAVFNDTPIPPKYVREKLQRELLKHHHEHLLVLRDSDNTQIWKVLIKHPDKPMQMVEVLHRHQQSPDFLLSKLDGLIFSLAEEGALNITDVVDRVDETFARNAVSVTKKFYEQFRKNLREFQEFIDGLSSQVNKEQYAALMLNRLMFIYFIQNKEFLDGDRHYLKNRLKAHMAAADKQRRDNPKTPAKTFYNSFYRHFLITLFHSGLGASPKSELRTAAVQKQIGKVPYLNGGLFDVHELEKQYGADIDIDDSAFKKLFDFFDTYNWHLDNRATASGNDINPDVIGYIFEKYINDRAKMGAYYTQEDITGYIARNTILPHLLRRAKDGCKEAFDRTNGTIWKLLRENPDDYIYDAVRKGGDLSDADLPAHIRLGLDVDAPNLLQRRARWNTAADDSWALPTETWRECLTRRERYLALKTKIANGDIADIADLTTYNLNIERLVFDALKQHEGTDFISAFFAAIAGRQNIEGKNIKERRGISVLDPACGSGAFLFAALSVLEPLYMVCISQMEEFVGEDDALRQSGKRKNARKHVYFRQILEDIDKHANREYWIYRSIILGNLFGVDIMPEATEVAKLRLFLKLAAVAEKDDNKPNMGLEPLPDIDFNIRAGNSLVGFAGEKDFLDKSGKVLNLSGDMINQIKTQAQIVGAAYHRFADSQTVSDINTPKFKNCKADLQKKLTELNSRLDKYLAHSYGCEKDEKFINWKESHQPFHWFSEFYGIMKNGGFDAIVGNPPYVKASSVGYKIIDSIECPDVYGHITFKSLELLAKNGNMGFIVMHNLGFGIKFNQVRENIKKHSQKSWFSFYGRIPSGLFDANVRVRNCIALIEKGNNKNISYTTRLHRWNSIARKHLFQNMAYTAFCVDNNIPMFNSDILVPLQSTKNAKLIKHCISSIGKSLYFRQSCYNFISISPQLPPCYDISENSVSPTGCVGLTFSDEKLYNLIVLFIAGRMCFSHWLTHGDDFRIAVPNIIDFSFPVSVMDNVDDMKILENIFNNWSNKLSETLQFKKNANKMIGSYNTSKLWHITDKSDLIFLKYMTKYPDKTLDAITTHIAQTVKTPLNIENIDEDE